MRYSRENRLEAAREALQHNLSVLGAFFGKAGIETIDIPFRASGGNVVFEDPTVTGKAKAPEVMTEMIDGLQDVRWTGAGLERIRTRPLALEAALRDACTYAADLRDNNWKDGTKGAVKFWEDGVIYLEMEILQPTNVREEYYPRPAPLEAPAGLPEPRPEGL